MRTREAHVAPWFAGAGGDPLDKHVVHRGLALDGDELGTDRAFEDSRRFTRGTALREAPVARINSCATVSRRSRRGRRFFSIVALPSTALTGRRAGAWVLGSTSPGSASSEG